LGYWLKYKCRRLLLYVGSPTCVRNGLIDGGLTAGIARTAPRKGLHKAVYTVMQRMWNGSVVLARIPFVGGKLVSAARPALGWIFSMVEGAIQSFGG
jgi:hypothetical protein